MLTTEDNKTNNVSENTKEALVHRIFTIVGIVLCVILIPMLIINCTLIIKSFINEDEVPSIGGVLPLIVLTDSMYPDIWSGDLIICKTAEPEDIEVGDVISFFDPASKGGTSVVTHKVIEIINEDGKISFRTRGTNNNTDDRLPVPADKLIAEYTGIRIPGAGNVALFMQSTTGLIVCVVAPILLFVGYDVIRRRMYEKENASDVDALKAELEALRAMKAEAEAKAEKNEEN